MNLHFNFVFENFLIWTDPGQNLDFFVGNIHAGATVSQWKYE